MANLSSMEAQLQRLFENSTEYRGLNFVTVEELNGFGCWCYFENDHGRGKSQPVSAVDGACKILHDGNNMLFGRKIFV